MALRKDVVKIDIQANAYVLVYHKFLDIGSGSSIGLYLYNKEFLKFDCFGSRKGHYHVFNKKTDKRIYFTEQTAKEQIEKTIHELTNNINSYLVTSPNIKIKKFVFDTNLLKLKLAEAKQILMNYEDKFYAAMR
jgi:hypothetical protein